MTTSKKFFAKRIILKMKNDDCFTFNYGMLSVDKLVEAIGI